MEELLGVMFLCGPCHGYIRSQLCIVNQFSSWKPVSTAQELQLKGASQQGQEPLDTEAEDTTPLRSITK
jgi:hypothetical protein